MSSLSRARFEFRPYARPFKQPLQTHHGKWTVRQGIILRLVDPAGQIGWGEIAPIPAFGSETWTEAFRFCQSLPQEISQTQIQQIHSALPACRFGLESAWEMLASLQFKSSSPQRVPDQSSDLPVSSILLPSGADALNAPQLFTAKPGSTFKWKIGIAPAPTEFKLFEELVSLLPVASKLRLDANGGLNWQQACQWLQLCDGYGVEFLEQPLPPDQVDLMLRLSHYYTTPLALDESVTTVEQLQRCYRQGWQGIFVIKAPLMGSPAQFRAFCQDNPLDLVWSSVFETAIARRYINDYLIAKLPLSDRATGFGVDHWFGDRWEQRSPEQIWQQLDA